MKTTVQKLVLGDLATNTYILTDEESGVSAVVDPAIDSDELFASIENKNVKYILLTHGHFDHIGGAKALKEKTGAQVVIHSEDAPMLNDGILSMFKLQYPHKSTPKVDADILVEDGSEIPFGNGEITVLHTPGHTRGGVCYIFTDDRILFSGDTLFKLSAGRTDFKGGNPREELMSLAKIGALEGDYIVYPGHSEDTTLQFERENNRYMRTRFRNKL